MLVLAPCCDSGGCVLLTMSAQPVRTGGTVMDAHNPGSNVSEDSSGSTGTLIGDDCVDCC